MDQAGGREAGADSHFPLGAPAHPVLDCRKLVPLLSGLTSDPGQSIHSSATYVWPRASIQHRSYQGAAPRCKGASPGGTPQYLRDGNLSCGKENPEPNRRQSSRRKDISARNFDP